VTGFIVTLFGFVLLVAAVIAMRWEYNLWAVGGFGVFLLVLGALLRRAVRYVKRKGLFVFPEGLLVVDGKDVEAASLGEIQSIREQDGVVMVERGQGAPPLTTKGLLLLRAAQPSPETVAQVREAAEALTRWRQTGELPMPPGDTIPVVPLPGAGGAILGTLLPCGGLAFFLFLTIVAPAHADTDKVCRRFVLASSASRTEEATALLAAPLRARVAREGFAAVVPQDLRRASDVTYNGVSTSPGIKSLEVWVSVPGGSPTWCFRMATEDGSPRVAGWSKSSCKRARW
jgi:hypothetical protein